MTERETNDLDVTGADVPHLAATAPDSGPEHRTDQVDPLADGVDVGRIQSELRGWGGPSEAEEHELSDEQVRRLQDRPEPIGGGETGRALHGDQGHADPIWQADAPETREPDTSLGHGGDGA